MCMPLQVSKYNIRQAVLTVTGLPPKAYYTQRKKEIGRTEGGVPGVID